MRCPCLLYLATAAWLASAPHFGAYVWHALAVLLVAPTLRFCCVPAHQRCGCGTALLLFVLLEAAFALALVNAEWEAARVCALDGAALPVWSRGFALCADVAPPAWEGGCGERGNAASRSGAPCATAPSYTCRRATCPSLWPARSRRSTRRRASSSSAAVRTSACRSSCGAARGGWWAPRRRFLRRRLAPRLSVRRAPRGVVRPEL